MDPYLEGSAWSDFHATFIPCWRRAINDVLPDSYHARIDANTYLIEVKNPQTKLVKPDVAIVYQAGSFGGKAQPSATATIEPVTLNLPVYEEIKERWIEIVYQPDNSLVAVLELLSPWDKVQGSGRGEYLAKRSRILRQEVHLIEVDLLIGGLRLTMDDPLPSGDYFAFVSRSERRPKCEVYPWGLRDRLPVIPIPLRAGENDIGSDLAAVFGAAYEMGGYAGFLNYAEKPPAPIPESDRQWATALAKSAAPA
jgi:hypothetical protein